MKSIQEKSRVKCGFASISDVETGRLDDRMDSYFLSETLKYLFMIFDEAVKHETRMMAEKERKHAIMARNMELMEKVQTSAEIPSSVTSCSTSKTSVFLSSTTNKLDLLTTWFGGVDNVDVCSLSSDPLGHQRQQDQLFNKVLGFVILTDKFAQHEQSWRE